MAKVPDRDSGTIVASAALTDIYTVPASTIWYGAKLRVKNVNDDAVYVMVFLYDADDTASREVAQFWLDTDEWESMDLSGDVMTAGDKVQLQCDIATATIHYWLSFAEESV